jgi:hypothetical protein
MPNSSRMGSLSIRQNPSRPWMDCHGPCEKLGSRNRRNSLIILVMRIFTPMKRATSSAIRIHD